IACSGSFDAAAIFGSNGLVGSWPESWAVANVSNNMVEDRTARTLIRGMRQNAPKLAWRIVSSSIIYQTGRIVTFDFLCARMLERRGVSKSYGKTEALQPTDLIIAAGRTTVLLGPSGCGKSTILRLMLGLLRPDSGTVLINDQPFRPDLRHRMGYVVQDGGLF